MTPDASIRATLTVEEVARLFGISRQSAYDGVRRGDIPSIRIGRRLLVPRGKIDEMLGISDGVLLPPP